MRTYEYRARPNKRQEQALMAVLIASRLLYNKCLEELVTHYKETGKYLHIYEQDKRHSSKEHLDIPAVVVDVVLKRVHRSFTNFFRGLKDGRRIGFPRFKGPNHWHTIQFRDPNNYLKGAYFHAPKICGGKIRVNVHRPLEGKFKFARFVLRPSGWYLQCVCETEPVPLPVKENAVGLDFGITYLAADSDGRVVQNPKNLKVGLGRLAKAQRKVAKCKDGSHRKRKAKRQVARVHEHIGNQRKDTLHKVSRHYVDAYQVIVVEDLNVAGMVRNHSLARSISDSAWGMLRSFLTSKAESADRQLVVVPAHFTSQRCSSCGVMVAKSLSVRTHVCPGCGFVADRDVNAARNILHKGLTLLARTGPSLRAGEGSCGNTR